MCMNATRLYIQVVKENAVEHNTENTTDIPGGIIWVSIHEIEYTRNNSLYMYYVQHKYNIILCTTIAVLLWPCEHGKYVKFVNCETAIEYHI